MRRNCLYTGTIIWCLFFLFSCQKEVINPPNIQVVSPEVHELIDLTYGLNVEIDLWDDQELLDYHIWLKSDSGLNYFEEKVLINKQSHTISYNFDFSNLDNDELTIKLRVRDVENNKVEKEITVLFAD